MYGVGTGNNTADPQKKKDKYKRKGKVVAAFIQFLAAVAFLLQDDFEKRMIQPFLKSSWCISPIIFKSSQCKTAMRGKDLNKFCPSNSSNDLYLFFWLYHSSMTGSYGIKENFKRKIGTMVVKNQLHFIQRSKLEPIFFWL